MFFQSTDKSTETNTNKEQINMSSISADVDISNYNVFQRSIGCTTFYIYVFIVYVFVHYLIQANFISDDDDGQTIQPPKVNRHEGKQ